MEKGKVLVRRVREDEDLRLVAGLAEIIWHECFEGIITRAQIRYMVDKFQSFDAMKAQMEDDNYEYYLAIMENRPVGYLGIAVQDDGTLMLSKMYTLAEVRGSGLATVLFRFVEKVAAERGCPTIWLTVNRHNERAVAAYEKHGFAKVREQVADIGGGFVMDDYVFEKPVEVAHTTDAT